MSTETYYTNLESQNNILYWSNLQASCHVQRYLDRVFTGWFLVEVTSYLGVYDAKCCALCGNHVGDLCLVLGRSKASSIFTT